MICSFCGTEISDSSKFCMECGKQIIPDTPPVCSNCGNELHPNAKFCSECGKTTEKAPPIKNNTNSQNKDPNDWKYFMGKEYEETVYCSVCGTACSVNDARCKKCGSDLIKSRNNTQFNDYPLGILKFASFLVPVVGLILYLTQRRSRPISAETYGIQAIKGVVVGVILSIISSIIFFFTFFY